MAETAQRTSSSSSVEGGLVWQDLSVRTQDGVFLLQNCSGMIPNGHLCGLLGPSGAGKVRTKQIVNEGDALRWMCHSHTSIPFLSNSLRFCRRSEAHSAPRSEARPKKVQQRLLPFSPPVVFT